MQHTPGPWTANGSDIMCDANYCVAVAYRARTDDDGNWMPRGEVDANARLIAAATELLAALKDAYDALDYAQAQVDSEADRMHLTRCRRKIKPVIDQAEGGR
jgi:hypothetical protein